MSPVGNAVGAAVSTAAPLVLCGADKAAVEGAGASSVLSVSVVGAGDVAVGTALATAFATAPTPVAVPSLLGSAFEPVEGAGEVAQGSEVVVADADDIVAVAVSEPSVVVPDGATASVAANAHGVSVAAVDVSVATAVLSAAVVVSVVADDVSVSEGDVSVGEDDVSVGENGVSVNELELVVPGSVVGTSDATTVVADVCASPVASALVIIVSLPAEAAEASLDCTVVSTVWTGGVGTSSALAGAIQADVEATPTITTAVQPIRRRSRRR